jgi:microcystin-dependent protein
MTDQFVGEIRTVGFNFAPQGWAVCNGQLLPINQNSALFSLLGTQYGGNGTTTFALPNLQARYPLHASGSGVGLSPTTVGQTGGVASVTISQATMPAHAHVPVAVGSPGNVNTPSGTLWAEPHYGRGLDHAYATGGGTAPMADSAFGMVGGGQAHNNLPPFLVVNFIIALIGIFPSRG